MTSIGVYRHFGLMWELYVLVDKKNIFDWTFFPLVVRRLNKSNFI